MTIQCASVTLLLALAGLMIDERAALLMLAAGGVYLALFCENARKRYRAIAQLSDSIDRILHEQERALISQNDEGELAILRSEIQKMVTRLRETADDLRADKQYLSDALADIAHQLRTPLTALNLTASLLTADELDDARRLQLARELKKSLRRVDWLIETLLKMSRIDAGMAVFERKPVAVKALLERVLEPLRIPMELRAQTVRLDVGEEQFMGDCAWSAEALSNVVKNCAEHTPPGGSMEISAAENALFTEIVVRDSGEGFDPDDLKHLFERFYRGKNAAAESVGIGLALARLVIVQQNGTITAANTRKGAQFVIRFYKQII